MAVLLKPTGFWSYARADEGFSNGRLTDLYAQVSRQLGAILGARQPLTLFRDEDEINFGEAWEKKINQALADACFFIAIITPTYLQSPWCLYEVDEFLKRQAELDRDDLIFGVRYISVDDVDFANPIECIDKPAWDRLCRHQAFDLTTLYHHDPTSIEVRQKLDAFVKAVRAALRRTTTPTAGAIISPSGPTPPPV